MGSTSSEYDDVNVDSLPDDVKNMYKRYKESGWEGTVEGQTEGTKAGGKYKNDGRDGSVVLPEATEDGEPITYKEFDVDNYDSNIGERSKRRFVHGSDGSTYYTEDHYKSFKKVWD